MSFDANIGRPQPVIRPTAGMNNDGGSGGNTGYMMRNRKKKKENEKSVFDSNVLDTDCFDSINGLSKHKTNPEIYEGSWFDKLVDKFIK